MWDGKKAPLAGVWVKERLAWPSELTLAKEIKHEGQLGREQHERMWFPVTVELVVPEKSLLLAQHPALTMEATVAA